MSEISIQNRNNRLHPRKLMMWMAIASMFMVFAGFTSAFLLQKGTRVDWANIPLPLAFWISTIVIIASSYTMHQSVKLFKERNMVPYRKMVKLTLVLGLIFMVLQLIGFWQLLNSGIQLDGGIAGAFLYVISGAHLLHMFGGVVALIIVYRTAFSTTKKVYGSLSHEVMAIFWHFVDILWIYLFIFFLLNFKF